MNTLHIVISTYVIWALMRRDAIMPVLDGGNKIHMCQNHILMAVCTCDFFIPKHT